MSFLQDCEQEWDSSSGVLDADSIQLPVLALGRSKNQDGDGLNVISGDSDFQDRVKISPSHLLEARDL